MELARRQTLDFCEVTKPDWVTAEHHKFLCSIADRIVFGDLRFAAVSLPPRHTKSEIFSIRMPALALGVHPEWKIIHASYASALSNEFSRQVRALVRDDLIYSELFPATMLDPERQRLDDWKTTKNGGLRSLGVGGGLSGHGADLLIIDDPLKEGDQYSRSVMRQIYEWYITAARTRLSPGGRLLIVGTRWDLFDLIGEVLRAAELSPLADQFEVINLPALARENDPMGRPVGAALWPARYSRNDLLAVQALSGQYFEALYQQDPQPVGKKLFDEKLFRRGLYESTSRRKIWAIDLAISEDETADYSVWGRWSFDEAAGVLAVTNIYHGQEQWPETKKMLESLMQQYPDDLFVFPKHTYELMAVQVLGVDYANQIEQVSLAGDKRERARVYSDVNLNGRAWVEEGANGDLFVREHDRFPDEHDDFVDMSSVASHYFFGDGVFDFLVGAAEKNVSPNVAA